MRRDAPYLRIKVICVMPACVRRSGERCRWDLQCGVWSNIITMGCELDAWLVTPSRAAHAHTFPAHSRLSVLTAHRASPSRRAGHGRSPARSRELPSTP